MKKKIYFIIFSIIILLGFVSILVHEELYTNNYEKRNKDENLYKNPSNGCIDKPITNEASVNDSNDSLELFLKKPEENLNNVCIKVYKASRRLELLGNGRVIGRFKIGLGSSPKGHKKSEGDRKTPEGEYYICTKNDKSKFTLSLGINYPNIEDAKRGLENGIIEEATFNEISKAINSKTRPPWHTPLGGEIMIHGGGNSSDWTLGCIALSNEDIRILWEYTSIGTLVNIYP